MKTNKSIKTFIVTLSLILLTACSSVESDLKTYMKCGIAANQLEKEKANINISKKLSEYIKEHEIKGSAGYAMHLSEEVKNEDLELYKKNLEGQIYTLVKVYNSSECKDIHEQDKISMPLKYYLLYILI